VKYDRSPGTPAGPARAAAGTLDNRERRGLYARAAAGITCFVGAAAALYPSKRRRV